jgi:hypothetical protein
MAVIGGRYRGDFTGGNRRGGNGGGIHQRMRNQRMQRVGGMGMGLARRNSDGSRGGYQGGNSMQG